MGNLADDPDYQKIRALASIAAEARGAAYGNEMTWKGKYPPNPPLELGRAPTMFAISEEDWRKIKRVFLILEQVDAILEGEIAHGS